tara:strand:+ start:534 stop:734 length:201 start_codon:yes stop_codon:yes gene_type:complete
MTNTATIKDHKVGLTAAELLLTGTGGQVEISYFTDNDNDLGPIKVDQEMVDTVAQAETKKTEWENS